jgi:serine/threonine-protein kinase HipA
MGIKARVYQHDILAGILEKTDNGQFIFEYDDAYFNDASKESISLTLPKSKKIHKSKQLFPYFFGLLTEGNLKALQCQQLKLDEDDHFTRLIKTAHTDTIGATTIKEIAE